MQVSTLLLTPVVRPAKSRPATPSEVTCFSYWSIKPWFLTEGKLAAVLIIPCSWGFPTSSQFNSPPPRFSGTITIEHHQDFLAPLPGRNSTSVRGVSHFQSFYFVIVLLVLFYFILFASLYQKHKKLVSIIAFISVALFVILLI